MIFRLLGLALSLALIGYFFYSYNQSRTSVNAALNNNPAIQSSKAALDNMGVNASDKASLEKYAIEQAKQIETYQDQLNKKP